MQYCLIAPIWPDFRRFMHENNVNKHVFQLVLLNKLMV